jgi:hypothetical protein
LCWLRHASRARFFFRFPAIYVIFVTGIIHGIDKVEHLCIIRSSSRT